MHMKQALIKSYINPHKSMHTVHIKALTHRLQLSPLPAVVLREATAREKDPRRSDRRNERAILPPADWEKERGIIRGGTEWVWKQRVESDCLRVWDECERGSWRRRGKEEIQKEKGKGWRLREEGMGQGEKQKGGEEQIRNSTCGQTALLKSLNSWSPLRDSQLVYHDRPNESLAAGCLPLLSLDICIISASRCEHCPAFPINIPFPPSCFLTQTCQQAPRLV